MYLSSVVMGRTVGIIFFFLSSLWNLSVEKNLSQMICLKNQPDFILKFILFYFAI